MYRYVINVLVESKVPLKDDLGLCDKLASDTYNRIAINGKTAEVTASFNAMPPLPWEVQEAK